MLPISFLSRCCVQPLSSRLVAQSHNGSFRSYVLTTSLPVAGRTVKRIPVQGEQVQVASSVDHVCQDSGDREYVRSTSAYLVAREYNVADSVLPAVVGQSIAVCVDE